MVVVSMEGSIPLDFKVVCLQRYPEYYEQTITLLNNQWPRSRTARMRSLEQGCKDSLPTSLILLHKHDNQESVVVAHSKISPVPYKPQLCFVESVIVDPELRGKGVGRLIMEHTEHYVKSLGITTVYLTTFDQQGFYSKLGYELCEPIVVFGGVSLKLAEKANNLKVFSYKHDEETTQKSDNQAKPNGVESPVEGPPSITSVVEQTTGIKNNLTPPRPPPLPLPQPQSSETIGIRNTITQVPLKVTMMKILCEN